jgi:hypothetical protein
MAEASQEGESTPIENTVIQISLWLNSPGFRPNYLGDSLTENVRVSVQNVRTEDPDSLRVVKMDTQTEQWKIIDPEPTTTKIAGDTYSVTFEVQSDVGFSVFQVIGGSLGVATTGRANESVVYPNPFIPFDGKESTGEYGNENNDGIHFGAGYVSGPGSAVEGFPARSKLTIYNVVGEKIDEIRTMQGGVIRWDARTRNNERAASGVYFYVIDVPNGGQAKGKFSIVR